MTDGYIYCFSNQSMPNILKIGMTERTPDIRLKEANISDTWKPSPFKIEFAKKVSNPSQKEKTLHTILKKYRVNSRREFFHVLLEEVRTLFDLIDGEMWTESHVESHIETFTGDNITLESELICEMPEIIYLQNEPELIKTKKGESINQPNKLCRLYISGKNKWIHFKLIRETDKTFSGIRLQQDKYDNNKFYVTNEINKWCGIVTNGSFNKGRNIYVYN